MVNPFAAFVKVVKAGGEASDDFKKWMTTLLLGVNRAPGNSVPTLFADLPVPVSGMLYVVTDSTTDTWGATVTGGGLLTVQAFYNGTNWTVAAK